MKNHADDTAPAGQASLRQEAINAAKEEKLARALKRNLQRRKQAVSRSAEPNA